MTTKTKVPNRLAQEKSPYLLQHANNPVDWFPWGEEAFCKAKAEDKPIFLSIGYSTCHWCHVMERESFEDKEIAQLLNKYYIAIKVDREERPDIDHIYMSVCQAMTGHGGWPLTIVMTPEKKPFFAGTYFPKESRRGQPGVMEILENIQKLWTEKRDEIISSGEDITQALSDSILAPSPGELESDILHQAFSIMERHFDPVYGGFGSAPKFPTPHNLTFLLRYGQVNNNKKCVEMVETTLLQMYKGGIFDHIGFGFSRYSTDRRWLVPHFEKMLYDNALLAIAYLECYQLTKKALYCDAARKIFDYVLRDMTSPEGAFYSAEDADSEGVEGKFYLWKPGEIEEVVGASKGSFYCKIYDIKEEGNFEGASIPNLLHTNIVDIEPDIGLLEEIRSSLFKAREKRIHPYKDDKILTAWNGMMIAALAYGGRILGESAYIEASKKALTFLQSKLTDSQGLLLARFRDGESAYLAYLDDYAFLVWGLLEMYEATYDPSFLESAVVFTEQMIEYYWDENEGGFFMTSKEAEELLARPREIYDGATPSGNSVAALNLLRLAGLTGEQEYAVKAQGIFEAFGGQVSQSPSGYTMLLQAFLYSLVPTREVIVVDEKGTGDLEMLKAINSNYLPHTVSLHISPKNAAIKKIVPSLEQYPSLNGEVTAYVCENFSCQSPMTEVTEFVELLRQENLM